MEPIEISEDIYQNVVIAALSVFRTGIVVLTLAAVKMLLPFLKYAIRMSDFHQSRRFSLRLSGIRDLKRVKTFADVMATEKLDFEKDGIKIPDIKP
jgi:hypothetical protein